MKDTFLSPNTIRYCFKAYGGEYIHRTDELFLLNPMATPEWMLKRFPPIRFITGSYDALRDDSYLFADRMLRAGHADVQVAEYLYFPHSFLQFAFPIPRMMGSYVRKAINKIAVWMVEAVTKDGVKVEITEPEEES